MTLYTALVSTAKVAAPMAPFDGSEEIYRNLVCSVDKSAPESVHLCLYPAYEESRVDKQLEAEMDEVLQVVTLGRAARNLSNLKNRQPLQALYNRRQLRPGAAVHGHHQAGAQREGRAVPHGHVPVYGLQPSSPS